MGPLFITFDLNAITNHAWVITIVAYCTVFFSLAILGIVFMQIHRIRDFIIQKQMKKKGREEKTEKPEQAMTGDVNAAICTALYLYFSELHDEEKYVMTVKKVSRTYSPWNSKVYGMWHSIK
jgi:glutaconyl-CoA/methylmalonyl-CoA decarboxylase subunit delta